MSRQGLKINIITEEMSSRSRWQFKLPQVCQHCGLQIAKFPFVRKYAKGGHRGKSYCYGCARDLTLI